MNINRKSFMIDDLLSSSSNNHTSVTSMATYAASGGGSYFTRKNCLSQDTFALYDNSPQISPNSQSLSLIQLLSLVGHPSLTAATGSLTGEKVCNSIRSPPSESPSSPASSASAASPGLGQMIPRNLLAIQSEIVRRKMLLVAKPRKGGQIRFTGKQVEILESLFHQSKYIGSDERKRISSKVKLSEKQIKTWFQNRRAKSKKTLNSPRNSSRDVLPSSVCSKGITLNQLNEYNSDVNTYTQQQFKQAKLMTSNINILFDNSRQVNEDTSSSSASTAPLSPSTSSDEL